MVSRIRFIAFLCAISLLIFASSARAEDPATQESKTLSGTMDQRALDTLKKMSDTLAQSKSVSFSARSMVPIKTPSGIWVSLFNSSRVIVQGQDKLFAETRGDFAPHDFYYDGKTITSYAPDKNLYAVKEAPDNLDAVIEQAYNEGGKPFPYADILVSEPYAVLTKGLSSAYFVGWSDIGGVKTSHLAFVNKGVEWQIWIGKDDNLPRLVNATYLYETNEPSYTVEFFNWKLNDDVPAETFMFKNTKNAAKIEFRKIERAPLADTVVEEDKK